MQLYRIADWIRSHRRAIDQARQAVTVFGPTPVCWNILAAAAARECGLFIVEALLDELAALCRGATGDEVAAVFASSHRQGLRQ